MKVFNFQELQQRTDINTSGGRIVPQLLKKPVGNQYLEVLKVLVPPESLVPLLICAQFERDYLCSTHYFSRSHI